MTITIEIPKSALAQLEATTGLDGEEAIMEAIRFTVDRW